jgi:hypothetical protein
VAVQKYTDSQMLDALRATAAGTEEPLTATGYDALRSADAPSSQAIIRRFGRWRDAQQRAGLASNRASGHTAHWSDEELIGWVARYLADPTTSGSYGGYLAWAQAVDGAPSGATIRIRFKKWSTVRAVVAAR